MANMPGFGGMGRALSGKAARMNPEIKEACFYLVKAVALVSFLAIVGKFATTWPAWIFPLVFLLYAAVATVGALYHVMVRRIHRQEMLNGHGVLSGRNRKWGGWFFVASVFSLFSAIVFTLESSRWGVGEWVLIWASIGVYYGVFLIANQLAKGEYRSQYHKARAMKWASIATLILLCVAYAALFAQGLLGNQTDASEILRSPFVPFENSSSALLGEMDKVSTFANNLTNFGLHQITAGSFVVALIVKFILGISIFLSVVSQLGSCLLGRKEIECEFRILPAKEDEEGADRPIVKGYFAAIAAISVVFVASFWVLDDFAAKARASEEYTAIDRFVDKWTKMAFDAIDDSEAYDIKDKYIQRKNVLIEDRKKTLDLLIEGYYRQCSANIDSYLDWSESAWGSVSGRLWFFNDDIALSSFKEKVVEPVGALEVERAYEDYVEKLVSLDREYRLEMEDAGLSARLEESLSQNEGGFEKVDLWEILEDKNKVKDALLSDEDSIGRENRKGKIENLVGEARQGVLNALESFEEECVVVDDDASGGKGRS